MSNRILLASAIAMLSMAVNAEPTTYTQIVPSNNGPVTAEVRVENGDFQMVSVLPPMTMLTIAIERTAAQEPDPGFVPGTYRSTLVGEHGEVAIEFTIGPRGVGEIKALDAP